MCTTMIAFRTSRLQLELHLYARGPALVGDLVLARDSWCSESLETGAQSVVDLRHRPELFRRRRSEPEKLQVGRYLLEQHVGAYLILAASFTRRC